MNSFKPTENSQIAERFGVNVKVESIFKSRGPFQESDKGFLGLVLINAEDKIHCHICDQWFSMLGVHVYRKHGITSDQYRKKYGLPLRFPLCGRGVSKKHSDAFFKDKHLARLLRLGKLHRLKGQALRKKMRRVMRLSASTAAHENKHGACPEQMRERYLIVCDQVGKMAGQNDLTKHDNALRMLIQRKYRNLNTFRKVNGFNEVAKAPIKNDHELLAELRNLSVEKGRPPMAKDLKGRTKVFRQHFGSFSRALKIAGII